MGRRADTLIYYELSPMLAARPLADRAHGTRPQQQLGATAPGAWPYIALAPLGIDDDALTGGTYHSSSTRRESNPGTERTSVGTVYI